MAAARQQPEPQRLLFVFLSTSLPKEPNEEQLKRFNSGEGGELTPVMTVDKTLTELGSFSDLVAESEAMNAEWKIVLIAGLSGKEGVPPTSEDAEVPLKMMVTAVETGGDLSKYIAFDQAGQPVHFG